MLCSDLCFWDACAASIIYACSKAFKFQKMNFLHFPVTVLAEENNIVMKLLDSVWSWTGLTTSLIIDGCSPIAVVNHFQQAFNMYL